MCSFISDARKFISEFLQDTGYPTSPLQLYNSTLLLSPDNSIIRCLFSDELPRWVKKVHTVGKSHRDEVKNDKSPIVTAISRLLASVVSRSRRTIKRCHSNTLSGVVFSPDGSLLASWSYEGTIGLWDPFTGTLLRMLKGHSEPVTAVVFSPDSQLLASASEDDTVRLWKTKTRTKIQKIQHKYNGHISFKDGSRLELDGRLFDVPSFSSRNSSHEQGSTVRLYSLDLIDKWVLYKGIRVLSIPRTGSSNSCVLSGDNLVVVYRHGLHFLRFSKTEFPSES